MKTTTASAVTTLVLLASAVGSLCVIAVPKQPWWGWWAVLSGLMVAAVLAAATTPFLLQTPPQSRGRKAWLARAHQMCALLLIGLGIRGVDGWWNTPEAQRPPMWIAFFGLAALGYLSVRLGMTATFLRPGPALPAPQSPREP